MTENHSQTNEPQTKVNENPAAIPYQIGPFAIVRKLGQGGMGIVFEAVDPENQQHVAIKILKYNIGPNALAIQRFHREIMASQSLSHPNIIPVLSVGEVEGTHYYVMPLVHGKNMDAILKTQKISINLAAHIAFQVAIALAHAHRRGVIHRDIKPGNIMLTEDKVFVTDFGLAKPEWAANLTSTGILVGTPIYMSPEQAQGVPYLDHRTDIYSLGVSLYEMLTGVVPFRENGLANLLNSIIHKNPVPPKTLNPQIPDSLNRIVLKAMQKNPAARYQNAELMAEDIRRYLSGLPVLPDKTSMFLAEYRHHLLFWSIFIVSALIAVIYCSLKEQNNSNNSFQDKSLQHKQTNTFFYILPPRIFFEPWKKR